VGEKEKREGRARGTGGGSPLLKKGPILGRFLTGGEGRTQQAIKRKKEGVEVERKSHVSKARRSRERRKKGGKQRGRKQFGKGTSNARKR